MGRNSNGLENLIYHAGMQDLAGDGVKIAFHQRMVQCNSCGSNRVSLRHDFSIPVYNCNSCGAIFNTQCKEPSPTMELPEGIVAGNKGLKYVAVVSPAKSSSIPYNVYNSDDLPKLTKFLKEYAAETVSTIHIYTRTKTLKSRLSVVTSRG